MTSKQLIVLIAASALSLQADTLRLRDGRTLQGTYLGGTTREIRFQENGGAERQYQISDVDGVSFRDGYQQSTSGSSADDRNRRDGREDGLRRQDGGFSRRDDRNAGSDRYRYGASDAAPNAATSGNALIPSGTRVTVRTIDAIDSDQNNMGQTFRASLDEPLVVEGRTVAPEGADVTLRLARVNQGGRISGSEEVSLELADIRANGRVLQVNSTQAEVASKSRGKQSAQVIGGTAVVGAIIGAIAGGGKGAAIGAASGAGAGTAVQAIRGQRVRIAPESKLDFTVTQPVYGQ